MQSPNIPKIENLTIAQLSEYMNQSPHQAGLSLCQGHGHPDHNTISERHYTSASVEGNHSQYCNETVSVNRDAGALHACRAHHGPSYGSANDFSQYHAFELDFDTERDILQDRQDSEQPPPFAPRNNYEVLRGIDNFVVRPSPGMQSRELERRDAAFPRGTSSPYNMPRRSVSLASRSPALAAMQSLPRVSVDHNPPPQDLASIRQTKYAPFQYRYADSVQARDFRRVATRFDRLPYYDPNTDASIAAIENNRQLHVKRIYNAMTSGEAAKDNRGSIAMKRWVLDSHYPAELVEAYAHKVFDCLLQQAKEGFRGWNHNDYVADERKGEDIDKDVDCAGRLDNIILALEHEKTICEDIMNSACQIRMFVNAPRAYANRKHQNRVGNSKRGRTKDTPDLNPKPTKAARTRGRRARARSATTSDVPSSRVTTPQYQQALQPSVLPYFHKAASQALALSPAMSTRSAPRSAPLLHRPPPPPATHSSFGQHSTTAMSPPAMSPQALHARQTRMPQMVTAPPSQALPHISPPPLSHDHFSTSATPEDAKPPAMSADLSWHETSDYGPLPYTGCQQSTPAIDPRLSQCGFANLTPCEAGGSSNIFDHNLAEYATCSLADLESQQAHQIGGSSSHDAFQDFWSAQEGVPYPHQP